MRSLRPIPARLLADDSVVRVADGEGGYAEGVVVSRVQFPEQFTVDEADERTGVVEVPAGSRIDAGGHSYYVAEVKRCGDFNGHVRHWELTV